MAAYNTISETQVGVEIAATVTGSLLPQLRDALLALQALKMAWYANGTGRRGARCLRGWRSG